MYSNVPVVASLLFEYSCSTVVARHFAVEWDRGKPHVKRVKCADLKKCAESVLPLSPLFPHTFHHTFEISAIFRHFLNARTMHVLQNTWAHFFPMHFHHTFIGKKCAECWVTAHFFKSAHFTSLFTRGLPASHSTIHRSPSGGGRNADETYNIINTNKHR